MRVLRVLWVLRLPHHLSAARRIANFLGWHVAGIVGVCRRLCVRRESEGPGSGIGIGKHPQHFNRKAPKLFVYIEECEINGNVDGEICGKYYQRYSHSFGRPIVYLICSLPLRLPLDVLISDSDYSAHLFGSGLSQSKCIFMGSVERGMWAPLFFGGKGEGVLGNPQALCKPVGWVRVSPAMPSAILLF